MARRTLLLPVLGAALVLAACSAPAAPPAAPAPPEPLPPASCLLDVAKLATATGIGWTAETGAATATRCVYDPDGPRGPAFVAVTLTDRSSTDTAAELDTIAQACDPGSRKEAAPGFVCRLGSRSVLAAVVDEQHVITVSASEVPAGTQVDALQRAIADQLTTLA